MALTATMVLAGCSATPQNEVKTTDETSIMVETVAAESGTLTLKNDFIGTISPEETVMIIPLANGTVTDTYFEVGDAVKEGDTLFKIDDTSAKLSLESAKLQQQTAQQSANSALTTSQASTDIQLESAKNQAQYSYETAQIAYVNAQNAVNKAGDALKGLEDQMKALQNQYDVTGNEGKEIIKPQMDALSAPLEAARTAKTNADMALYSANSNYKFADESRTSAEESAAITKGAALDDTNAQLGISLQTAALGVESAELALSYYTVKSPISGTIESKNVDVNGLATSSQVAYTIANNNTMTVTFYVSEAVKNTLTAGNKILVDRNGATYDATITAVEQSVDPQAGLFKVKACVTATGEELPSGVSVKITADTYSQSSAMLIPYDAIYYDNGDAYVYVIKDGKAVKTFVETGIFDDDTMSVLSGLTPEDQVITSWSPQLTDGVKVTAAPSEENSESVTVTETKTAE